MNAGLIGGILGGVLGIAGGVIGTYFSIKNTNGPKERSFMIKTSIVFWIFAVVFITFLLVIRSPYKWFLWIPYGVFLPISIQFVNKRLSQIRKEELQNQ